MPRRSKKGPQPAPVFIHEGLHGDPDDVTHELENYIPQHQEDPQKTEKQTKLHQTIRIVEDRVAQFRPPRPAFMQRLPVITTVCSVDEEGGCHVNVMNAGLADWDVHFWTEPVPQDECPDRVDILPVDDDSDEKPQPSTSTTVFETESAAKTRKASQGTKYQRHQERMMVLHRTSYSQFMGTPHVDEEEGDLLKEDADGRASFHWPLSCHRMRYTIPRKLFIQRQLREVTELDCIPYIEAEEQNVIVDTNTGPLHLSWVAENAVYGVPVWSVKSNAGIDQLFIVGLDGEVEKLKGRKKERFLDDLARIQVAYASITSPHLGPVILRNREDPPDKGLFSDLPDDEEKLVADIVPTAGDAALYLQHLFEAKASQHVTVVSQLNSNDHVKYIPGPYPLIPPQPLIQNLEVNPVTGNIISLNNSHETQSVPWEIAAQCPLSLSAKNQAKYRHSLKRQFLGVHMKREIASEPRLDQLMFNPALEIVVKLLELQDVKDGIEDAE